jgi:hypothetical protein
MGRRDALAGEVDGMASTAKLHNNSVHEMTALESNLVFDRAARQLLEMSGEEFIQKWNSGYFGTDPDATPFVMEVAALMPTV